MSDSNLGLTNQPDVTSSRTQEMIEALKGGASLTAGRDSIAPEVPEVNSTPEPQDSQPETDKYAFMNEDSEDESHEAAGSEGTEDETDEATEAELSASPDSDDSELTSAATEGQASADIEEITVTGPKGRRKIKVDFSDKDKIKKHVQLAYGARKWQKERDDAQAQLKELQTDYEAMKKDWDRMDELYKEGGLRALVNTIEGSDEAFEALIDAELKRKQEWEKMSPVEREMVEREKRLEAQAKQSERTREEYEKKLQEIQQRQEQAETRQLESQIHPSFDRYRFAGKLGDAVAEHEFDQLLWTRALGNLEKIPEDVEITQAVIDREFRKIANTINKHLNSQVQSKVKTAINKNKKAAASKAQAKVKQGMTGSSSVKEFRDNMKRGDIVGGLTSFFKAGGKL